MLPRVSLRMADAKRNDRNAIRTGPRRGKSRNSAPYAAPKEEPRLCFGRDRRALDERAVLERRRNDDDQIDRADRGRRCGITGRESVAEPDRRVCAHLESVRVATFGDPLEFLRHRCYHHDTVPEATAAGDKIIDIPIDVVHPRPSGEMVHDDTGNGEAAPAHRPRNGARRRECGFRNADDQCIAGMLLVQ